MSELAQSELDAIRERVNRATEGPWFYDSYSRVFAEPLMGDEEGEPEVASVPAAHGDTATGRHAHDAGFIAHARKDVPRLLAHIATLERRIAELEGATND